MCLWRETVPPSGPALGCARLLEPCARSLHSSRLLADVYFIATLSFLWKVSVITLVSCLPLYVLKYLRRRFSPPSYSKLTS